MKPDQSEWLFSTVLICSYSHVADSLLVMFGEDLPQSKKNKAKQKRSKNTTFLSVWCEEWKGGVSAEHCGVCLDGGDAVSDPGEGKKGGGRAVSFLPDLIRAATLQSWLSVQQLVPSIAKTRGSAETSNVLDAVMLLDHQWKIFC